MRTYEGGIMNYLFMNLVVTSGIYILLHHEPQIGVYSHNKSIVSQIGIKLNLSQVPHQVSPHGGCVRHTFSCQVLLSILVGHVRDLHISYHLGSQSLGTRFFHNLSAN